MSGMAARNVLKASAEAYVYVSRHPGIAPMLLLFTITTIGTRGFVELFPGFADDVFQRGAGRAGDLDLDRRARRDLRRRLDAACARRSPG